MDRSSAIALALKSYRENGSKRTLSIEFRGKLVSLEVVTLNPDVPYFNPNNSRLRAQLAGHPKLNEIRTQPLAADSQAHIQALLAQTDKFGELKDQLHLLGQQEPGLISRSGMLVNGNTRLAGIRSLGLPGIDVAVLPEEANDDDFFQIEMQLQLRHLVHQDYTFTNRLLLVESILKRTGSRAKTISDMQWIRGGDKKLDEHLGCLALVEEIRRLNGAISYSFFDTKEEAIKNLHQQYSALQKSEPLAAERLKDMRVLGLLLGLNKDEVREMGEDFLEEHFLPAVDGDSILEEMLASSQTQSAADSVLDELLGNEDQPATHVNLKKLASDIARKVIDEKGQLPDELIDADKGLKKMHDVLRDRSRRIREERIASDLRSEPIEYLKDVTDRIQKLADEIPILFKDDKFNSGAFKYQAKKTEKAIQALQDALSR